MSPDDIFAAQFWPWPDPAIKRDAQGRILFVNAAFLGIYGGRVEDWRGNAVGGWPAPQAAPYRFETRLPAADGSEQIYDWMEQTLADGNAFALARNVTVFMQAPDPDPAYVAPVEVEHQVEETQEDVPVQAEIAAQQAPAFQPAFQAETAQPAYETQTAEAPVQPETEFTAPPAQAPTMTETPAFDAPAAQADPIPVPEIEIPKIEIPSDEAYAMTETPAQPKPLNRKQRPRMARSAFFLPKIMRSMPC